ncbi:MAG: hypothetical protein AB1489_15170, partial [Acidobacteriota bacterium]
AYACLAETLILCLEGRYESFTLGRDINLEGVKEIYKMGLKHGFKLAAIRGHKGVFTDQEIALVRARAEEARARMGLQKATSEVLEVASEAEKKKPRTKATKPRTTTKAKSATTETKSVRPAKAAGNGAKPKQARKAKAAAAEAVSEVAAIEAEAASVNK